MRGLVDSESARVCLTRPREQGNDVRVKIMKYPVHIREEVRSAVVIAVAMVVAVALLESAWSRGEATNAKAAPRTNSTADPIVDLSPSQLNSIKIETVGSYQFPVEKEAVGTISFADDFRCRSSQPIRARSSKPLLNSGDEVQKDQPLYTIKSPDLIQAESNLIGAAATFDLTNKELVRVKDLTDERVSQREKEQAISDQQTADGALKAARDAVRVFGKTEAEMDQMIASRKIDPALVVRSPISGQGHAFNAPPACLVQPGNPPAPYTVANVSVKWMLADVPGKRHSVSFTWASRSPSR